MNTSKKILIVDDDPDWRWAMQKMLSSLGHKTCCANDGKMALEKINEVRPSLIFCDVKMPTMTGLEFLEKLKASPSKKHQIPVVLVSAESSASHEAEAMGAEFLNKTFQFGELAKIIGRYCP